MLELYQFELSHYCEKIRLMLNYKGLPYQAQEVAPGIGQVKLFQLSGQRQVPVLKDGEQVITDSTAIAQYLEQKFPEHLVIPSDPKQKALCLMMEEWADSSIGLNGRVAMIGAFNQHPDFRAAFLKGILPDSLQNFVRALPGDALTLLGTSVGFGADAVKAAHIALAQNLEALCLILAEQPYLLGEQPTLADFAVAGLSMYVCFPTSPALNIPLALKGMGVPGLADRSEFAPFFSWRDQLYADFRKADSGHSNPASGPQTIPVED
ncbi:MAG: glutathione S-transferase N-terminal domain-containing protein [Cyanobacteria bacterium P01_H01_bin.121]